MIIGVLVYGLVIENEKDFTKLTQKKMWALCHDVIQSKRKKWKQNKRSTFFTPQHSCLPPVRQLLPLATWQVSM
jgi:hypothetical protein